MEEGGEEEERWEKLERERAQNDPMYQMLMQPDTLEFAETIIDMGQQLASHKYENMLEDNPCIASMFALTTGGKYEGADAEIKVFLALLLIEYEPRLADVVERSYAAQGCSFHGELGPSRFRQTMQKVRVYVKQTLEFPYNTANIVEIVRNFVLATRTQYIMGL